MPDPQRPQTEFASGLDARWKPYQNWGKMPDGEVFAKGLVKSCVFKEGELWMLVVLVEDDPNPHLRHGCKTIEEAKRIGESTANRLGGTFSKNLSRKRHNRRMAMQREGY